MAGRARRVAALSLALTVGAGIAVVAALPAKAAQATFACAPVPSPSASGTASPTPTPTGLCVSVLALQSSVSPGGTVDWTVTVWTQGSGMLSNVWVSLSTDVSGVSAAFTGSCPSGNGGANCKVGDLGTGGQPTPYQLSAQVQIPSSVTSISSLGMTAVASATTDPPMGFNPAAGQSVSVTVPSPSPSPSSASASASHTPSSGSSSAKSTAPARSGTSAGTTAPPVTTPSSAGQITLPPGPMPVIGGVTSALATSTNPGELPVVAPGPIISPSSSPAANAEPLPAASSSSADANRFTLTIGMPAATALALSLVLLALAIAFASTRMYRGRRGSAAAAAAAAAAAGRGGGGDKGGGGGTGAATQVLRRPRGSLVAKWLPGRKGSRRRPGSVPQPVKPESGGQVLGD